MAEGVVELLERRLLLVMGKGGTGRTTIAAALGWLAARKGLRTVVVEIGRQSELPGLLGEPAHQESGVDLRQPQQVSPNLYVFRLVPEEALLEYLELQLRIKLLARHIVRNAGSQRLLDAAPGWRDLITLGKLWHLESRRDEGRPRWDLLVVDAPATGQGISLLSIPSVTIEAVHLGPLRRHTEWVQELILDPARTLVVPVTLPEELPVSETLEFCVRLKELGLAAGPIIANGIETLPELPALDTLSDAMSRVENVESTPDELDPRVLTACVRHAIQRSAFQHEFLEKLERESGRRVARVPYLPQSLDSPEQLAMMAEVLARSLDDAGGRV